MVKHSFYATLVLMLILFLAACRSAEYHPDVKTTVTLVHTNDFHSQLEPFYPDGEPSQGGVARLAALVNKIRAEKGEDNVLLLSGGDMFQGSFFYNAWLGSAEVMVQNYMRYDAVTLGNHEFDSGPKELARALRGSPATIAGKTYQTEPAKFLVLGTNLDISNEPDLQGIVLKRAILKKGGRIFGLLGVTTQQTATGSKPGNVKFLDYVPAIQEQADLLKHEGVDKIILMSHVGYAIDLTYIPELSGVDVVVSGHDHALLSDATTVQRLGVPKQVSRIAGPYPTVIKDKDGNSVVVVSAMEKGRWLGEIDIGFDAGGHVIPASLKPNLTFVRGCDLRSDKTEDCSKEVIAPDPALAAKVAEYGAPMKAFADVVKGEALVTFSGRSNENKNAPPMGDLIAEMLLDKGNQTDKAVAALMNRGGIRTDLVKGTVRYKDINAVMPFDNHLALIDLTGDELIKVLDHGLTLGNGKSSGAFPYVAGMTVYHCTAKPCAKALHGGGVVTAVKIGGKKLDKKKTYRIATIDYLTNGGDLYASLSEPCNRSGNYCKKTDLLIKDIIGDWFVNHSPVKPIPAQRLVAVK